VAVWLPRTEFILPVASHAGDELRATGGVKAAMAIAASTTITSPVVRALESVEGMTPR
jgi:hypothetical protein